MSLVYSLAQAYTGQGLIDGFNFVTTELTGGFVNYQAQAAAKDLGLYQVNDETGSVLLTIDTNDKLTANGQFGKRKSVRIESKTPVNKGLVVADFNHMPGSTCGAWPAFWLYGPNFPAGGEIDIIEGANTARRNLMSAHTSAGCSLPNVGFTGVQTEHTDCGPDPFNYGCNYASKANDDGSYGDSFNAVGGGVYAMEWTDEAIKIWNFQHSNTPADIKSDHPDTTRWGAPTALFGGSSCDVEKYFNNMKIVIDLDLCGNYASNVWGVTDNCPTDTGALVNATNGRINTCEEWVAGYPQYLKDIYWDINYIKVYDAITVPANNGTGFNGTIPRGNSTVEPEIPGWTYVGCLNAGSTFDKVVSRDDMTPIVCTELCPDKKFSAVYGNTCYCADTIDPEGGAVDDAQCGTPCPGDARFHCGGIYHVANGTTTTTTDTNSTMSMTSTTTSSSTATVTVGDTTVTDGTTTVTDDGTTTSTDDGTTTSSTDDGTPTVTVGETTVTDGTLTVIPTTTSTTSSTTTTTTTSALTVKKRSLFAEFNRRAAPPGVLLTVFENTPAGVNPGGNGAGAGAGGAGGPTGESGDGGIPLPAPAIGGNAATSGPQTVTSTITTTLTYTEVCTTGAFPSLVVTTLCQEIVVTNCDSTPSVPMSTVVKECAGCAGAQGGVVTLTVPAKVAVATAGASGTGWHPVATGSVCSAQSCAGQCVNGVCVLTGNNKIDNGTTGGDNACTGDHCVAPSSSGNKAGFKAAAVLGFVGVFAGIILA